MRPRPSEQTVRFQWQEGRGGGGGGNRESARGRERERERESAQGQGERDGGSCGLSVLAACARACKATEGGGGGPTSAPGPAFPPSLPPWCHALQRETVRPTDGRRRQSSASVSRKVQGRLRDYTHQHLPNILACLLSTEITER